MTSKQKIVEYAKDTEYNNKQANNSYVKAILYSTLWSLTTFSYGRADYAKIAVK